MAATVDNVVESKREESTPTENSVMEESTPIEKSVMETARAKGIIAIGIAKLQPTVRLLIVYAKL